METKIKMDDLKFYAVNLSTLGVGMVHINELLTTLTLLVGLGYGIHRWIRLARKQR